jgi:hypothetical protein
MSPLARPDLALLERRLLQEGGTTLVGGDGLAGELEPLFVQALLTQGIVSDGRNARLVPGAPSRCHENAARYVALHPAAAWWTGLALSDDGRWRVHSWAVTSHGTLVETTTPRLRYLGLPAAFDPIFVDEFSPARRTVAMRRFRREYGTARGGG